MVTEHTKDSESGDLSVAPPHDTAGKSAPVTGERAWYAIHTYSGYENKVKSHLEARIAECEAAMRRLEQMMSEPGFYENREAAQPILDQHQALMWQVGDLLHQWEQLQAAADLAEA